MTQEALKLALEALAVRFSEGWHEGIKIDASDIMLLSEAAQALAQEQEPVAWRTFDGEGQYEYRAYEENESYADEWDKRNPNHKGWVDPLYTHPPQRTWVGIEGEEIRNLWEEATKPDRSTMTMVTSFARALEAKLKEKNT